MTGLTNNEIVINVYREYRVKNLITHMIDYSIKDDSCYDLEQYIYEQLLKMNNVRLNTIYHSNKLRNFISQIIKSQRNGGVNGANTEYVNYLRIKDQLIISTNTNSDSLFSYRRENEHTIQIAYDDEYDRTIDYVIVYIDKKAEMLDDVKYTSDQLKTILAFTVLKKYYMSDLTQIKLAKHLGLSRSTINTLMRLAKADIKLYWERYGRHLD